MARLSYSTYLGGREYDEGIEIAVDLAGQAYVAGDTDSIHDFPTRNTLQGPPGNRDLFVTKLNATATDFVFSTYLGGSGVDNAADIVVDAAGDAYVIGTTTSNNFPVGSPLQATLRGPSDVFITKINAAGTARVWSTYLGGLSDDVASSIAIDSQSNLYLAGSTISVDFPHIGAQQAAMGGAQDAFVAKIAGCDIVLAPTAATFGVQCRQRVILRQRYKLSVECDSERFELDHDYQSRHGLSDGEHYIHDRREYRLRANRLYLGKRRSVRNYAGRAFDGGAVSCEPFAECGRRNCPNIYGYLRDRKSRRSADRPRVLFDEHDCEWHGWLSGGVLARDKFLPFDQ